MLVGRVTAKRWPTPLPTSGHPAVPSTCSCGDGAGGELISSGSARRAPPACLLVGAPDARPPRAGASPPHWSRSTAPSRSGSAKAGEAAAGDGARRAGSRGHRRGPARQLAKVLDRPRRAGGRPEYRFQSLEVFYRGAAAAASLRRRPHRGGQRGAVAIDGRRCSRDAARPSTIEGARLRHPGSRQQRQTDGVKSFEKAPVGRNTGGASHHGPRLARATVMARVRGWKPPRRRGPMGAAAYERRWRWWRSSPPSPRASPARTRGRRRRRWHDHRARCDQPIRCTALALRASPRCSGRRAPPGADIERRPPRSGDAAAGAQQPRATAAAAAYLSAFEVLNGEAPRGLQHRVLAGGCRPEPRRALRPSQPSSRWCRHCHRGGRRCYTTREPRLAVLEVLLCRVARPLAPSPPSTWCTATPPRR